MTDARGLYGHHPDCPHSRHGDSVLVRTAMHPCSHCDVADKAEKRGYDNGTHDVYQSNFVFSTESWDIEVKRIAGAENARIREGVLDYYAVAPKAAEPILRIIDGE